MGKSRVKRKPLRSNKVILDTNKPFVQQLNTLFDDLINSFLKDKIDESESFHKVSRLR